MSENECTQKSPMALMRRLCLSAAEAGEPVCDEYGAIVKYIGKHNDIVYFIYPNNAKMPLWNGADALFMKPLCWVECKPVYKGDVLYHVSAGRLVIHDTHHSSIDDLQTDQGPCHSSNLTWTKPRVKREGWVNVYAVSSIEASASALTSHAYSTIERAHAGAGADRLACVRIEWEE